MTNLATFANVMFCNYCTSSTWSKKNMVNMVNNRLTMGYLRKDLNLIKKANVLVSPFLSSRGQCANKYSSHSGEVHWHLSTLTHHR